MKEYLPLGSIVMLVDGQKAIMVYGRKQIHAASGQEFDYVACLYPEGNINDDFTYLFNHDQIAEVIHTGYADEEDAQFVKEVLLEEVAQDTASQEEEELFQ